MAVCQGNFVSTAVPDATTGVGPSLGPLLLNLELNHTIQGSIVRTSVFVA
jgi:hypothetical protein